MSQQTANARRHDAAVESLAMLAAGRDPVAERATSQTFSVNQAERFIRGLDVAGTSAGLGGPSDPFTQHWVVYRCVTKLAQAVGSIPMRLSMPDPVGTMAAFGCPRVRVGKVANRSVIRGERAAHRAAAGQIVEGGELFDLLANPNRDQAWAQFATQFVGLAKTSGYVVILLLDMVGRRPRELRLLGESDCEPAIARGRFGDRLLGWNVRGTDGSRNFVDRDDAIALVNFNPTDPVRGLSPLKPASMSIISSYNAETYNAAAFANSCEPGLVLSTDAEHDAVADAEMRRKLAERHAGAGKNKRPLILWGGMKVEDFGRSMQDMEFTEGQRLKARQVCASLEVDEVVIGLYTDANYQFAEQGRMNFWQDTVLPWADRLAGLLAAHLSPRFVGDLDVWADVETVPIVQKMRLARFDAAGKLWGWGVPLNDVNSMLDLGIPDRPWHYTGFLPIGLQPAGEAAAGGFGITLPSDETNPDDGLADEPDKSVTPRAPEPEPNVVNLQQRAANGRTWAAWLRSWSPLARAFQQALRVRYVRQERTLVAAVKREVAGKSATKDDGVIGRILLSISGDKGEWRAKVAKFVKDAKELGIRQALVEAGLSGDRLEEAVKRLMSNARILEAIKSESLLISTRIDDATRRSLRTSLTDGLGKSETALELANRVQDVMGNRRSAAVSIARNTMGQALSDARFAGQREAGMKFKFWIYSRGPGKRRPAHVAAEGRYRDGVPMDEPFEINGVRLMYPRDAAGTAAEIINCMCLCVARPKAPAKGELVIVERFVTYTEMLNSRAA